MSTEDSTHPSAEDPTKPDNNSDSDDESSLSSSGSSSSSDSSDSDSDNEHDEEHDPDHEHEHVAARTPPHNALHGDRKLSVDGAALTIPSDAREKAKAEPMNVNPTRAVTRAKEKVEAEFGMITLGKNKRDRRTIEEIQRDLKRKRGVPIAASSSGAGAGTTAVVPKRPAIVPGAIRRSPPRRSPTTSPEPEADRFGTTKGSKGKYSARQRLMDRMNGRGRGGGAAKPKKPASSMSAPTLSYTTNVSKGTVIISRASTNDLDSLANDGKTESVARMEPKLETKVVEPKPDVRVYRLVVRMLMRYGDLTDVNLYTNEFRAAFADEYKLPNFVQRSSLHSTTKISEATLLKVAVEMVETACKSIEEKKDVMKLADIESAKPSQLIERLNENFKLRVAVQRALAVTKASISKRASSAYILVDRWCDLSSLGIDIRQCPPWTWAEKEHKWNTKKDTALLVGIYIHGFGAWEDIINDDKLHLDIPRGTKGERLKKRAENLLKKLPTPEGVVESAIVGKANALVASSQGPSPQWSSIINKTVSKPAEGSSQRPSDRLPIRRSNGASSSDPEDSGRTVHSQSSIRRAPVGSPSMSSTTRSDVEDNGDARHGSRQAGRKTKRSTPVHETSGSKHSGSDGEPSPTKKVRHNHDAHVAHVRRRMLTEDELAEKWKPSKKLKTIRRDLKKLKAMRKWSQQQRDEVVVEKMYKYVTTIGDAIDGVVVDSMAKLHESEDADELCTSLWQYAASHTPYTAEVFERLYDDVCADGAQLREESRNNPRVAA